MLGSVQLVTIYTGFMHGHGCSICLRPQFYHGGKYGPVPSASLAISHECAKAPMGVAGH